MGLFDFLRSRPAPVTDDPEELRDQLFDAVGKKDLGTLRRLVDARAELIAASFEAWRARQAEETGG
jgi:hypothetical protein